LVEAKVIYADHERATWTVKPSPKHRWYFKKHQTPDEVMLIKCFDTDEAAPGRRVPHSAFADPEYDAEEEDPRESVEVRAFVFFN